MLIVEPLYNLFITTAKLLWRGLGAVARVVPLPAAHKAGNVVKGGREFIKVFVKYHKLQKDFLHSRIHS